MVSQKDVARKAGVSFMTVSRVINNRSNVDDTTRKKVLKAVREMGYYPNILGRGLNINRTFSIGVIIPFTAQIFGTAYYIDVLKGIEKACADNSYEIVLCPKISENEKQDYLKLFLERKADGVLIIAPEIDDPQVRLIDEKNVPCVVVDGRQQGKNIVFIDGDNVKGAVLATSHLISMGHRRIGFIKGWDFVRNGADRLNGYKTCLKEHGIAISEELIVAGDFTQQSGYEGMMKLLGLAERPSALFAGNDLMALGAMKAIQEKGLEIPKDISIVGYDNIQAAQFSVPPLTTVRQFSSDMGYVAADLLIKRINDKKCRTESRIFDVELVVRRSVAAPRS
jgi:DNA-binding LacI/PurR family transcriptional regulator